MPILNQLEPLSSMLMRISASSSSVTKLKASHSGAPPQGVRVLYVDKFDGNTNGQPNPPHNTSNVRGLLPGLLKASTTGSSLTYVVSCQL